MDFFNPWMLKGNLLQFKLSPALDNIVFLA